ncbi:MAG: hypothetical protein ACYCQK_00815 [Acidiferrobacteraceae bacterium]
MKKGVAMAAVIPGGEWADGTGTRASTASRVEHYAAKALRAAKDFSNYLAQSDFQTLRRDAETRIRERPVAALLVGIGIGIAVGKLVRSR